MMRSYKYIIESTEAKVGKITLNRLEVNNAFHIEMIREIASSFKYFNEQKEIRLIKIEAQGVNFSAGADLNWMKSGQSQSKEELYEESLEMAMLFNSIYHSQKVTMILARGKAIGGAIGLIAASDIVIGSYTTSFAFSEARLGLIPATIAPYVILKAGKSTAKEWMLTSRKIGAEEAYNRGLINYLVKEDEIENESQLIIDMILRNGPNALSGIKKLFREINDFNDPDKLLTSTAQLIAEYRISDEAQEGITAFFEKRQARWYNEEA